MHATYRRNGNRGLTIVRALLLTAAVVVVAALGYRQVRRMTVKRVPVWVSVSQLGKGRVVRAADVKSVQMPVPNGVLVNGADIEGRALLADKPEGQPFYPSDLAPRPARTALAATIPKGRLLSTLRIGTMDLPAQELVAGDRLDVLLAQPDGVHVVAHDVYMLGLLTSKANPNAAPDSGRVLGVDISVPGAHAAPTEGAALVLAIYPEESFSLAAAEATGKRLKLVLHSDSEVRAGEILDLRPEPSLPPPAPRQAPTVEVFMGGKREKVPVN